MSVERQGDAFLDKGLIQLLKEQEWLINLNKYNIKYARNKVLIIGSIWSLY